MRVYFLNHQEKAAKTWLTTNAPRTTQGWDKVEFDAYSRAVCLLGYKETYYS
jgi:hypothetical protein